MQEEYYVIVGLGVTGLSCAHYLAKKNIPFAVVDSRESPPGLAELKQRHPKVPIGLGSLDHPFLDQATHIILSPGVALREPAIQRQLRLGKNIWGDIELFAREVTSPVIAITGTNAKSTVTTLVGEMALTAGLNARVGGNLGVPALDLLDGAGADVFVLELSSFQLETTQSLAPTVATVLNVTPDHMDRYATFEDYCKVKRHIYQGCSIAVCNQDDLNTECGDQYKKDKWYFTCNEPSENAFGLLRKNHNTYLAHGSEVLLPVEALPVLGRHYQANALAALAIGYGYGLPMDAMLKALTTFKGLPHRCQLVRERNGVCWYNDSKGTNVGATLAAIDGLGSDIKGRLVLIAGGVGKNADFSALLAPAIKYVKAVVLIGEAAPILAALFKESIDVHIAGSMEEAVALSEKIALPGDSVLLSPACASLDMFKNFEHRGNVFAEIVQAMP